MKECVFCKNVKSGENMFEIKSEILQKVISVVNMLDEIHMKKINFTGIHLVTNSKGAQ